MKIFLLAAALAVQQPQPAQPAQRPDVRDPNAVTRLLASLRTADPEVCELAGRTLTNQWGWSAGSDFGDEPMPAPMPTPMPVPMPMPFAGDHPDIPGPKVRHRSGMTT